jgi:hypothetical protein
MATAATPAATAAISAGTLAYTTAIDLGETLRRQRTEHWPPQWAHDLAAAYMNRGIALEDSDHLEIAVNDWKKAGDVLLDWVKSGMLGFGTNLLKTVVWRLEAFQNQSLWTEAAQALVEFLNAFGLLQSQWPAEKSNEEPPWQEVVTAFAQRVHALDLEERTALLNALGEDAETVKKSFGWE